MRHCCRTYLLIAAFILTSLLVDAAFGDTIMQKDGKKIKGLIVDEYADRLVVSTFEGEKTVKREDITYVIYEEEESRLTELAERALENGRYDQSIYYYKKVLETDPGSDAAKDGIYAAIRKQLGAGAEIAKEEIGLMNALEEGEAFFESRTKNDERNVLQYLGLKIAHDKNENACVVKSVSRGSVAYENHVQRGDIVSSVWNKSVKYMPYKDVIKNMAGPEFSNVKLDIERTVFFDEGGLPDIKVRLVKEGHIIERVSGLSRGQKYSIGAGDWLLEINSASTRYMKQDVLEEMLDADKKTSLRVKRKLYLRREKRR